MLYPPGFYYVKKPKRFVIFSSDKSSERNLSCFFDIKKPRRIEHLQSEEPFSSDPYFRKTSVLFWAKKGTHFVWQSIWQVFILLGMYNFVLRLNVEVLDGPESSSRFSVLFSSKQLLCASRVLLLLLLGCLLPS